MSSIKSVATAAALVAAGFAQAHVGTSNLTTPSIAGGQATFLLGNVTSELTFNVGHGCNAEAVPPITTGALDTSKVKITIPAEVVASTAPRGTYSGAFGIVTIADGTATGTKVLTWTKAAGARAEAIDDQFYKLPVRLRAPATTTIKRYTFDAAQYCVATAAVPGGGVAAGTEVVLDWAGPAFATNQSPTVMVFPDKRKGWNQFKLDASAVSAFTATTTGTLASALKSHFGDAEIVWVGKKGYSANPETIKKIDALIAKDSTYSRLDTATGAALTTADTIWVKY
jgi:hypothetical protein